MRVIRHPTDPRPGRIIQLDNNRNGCLGLLECPYCGKEEKCRNDMLFHIIKDHDANMERWDEV